ncbi:MAG: hypothetical protein FWG68_04705 [Defluviitaleaceae bacterium]|nr:hypothetical protein [Defluviitaleaceae bacterium]
MQKITNKLKHHYNRIFRHYVGKKIRNRYDRFNAHFSTIAIHGYIIWAIARTIVFFAGQQWDYPNGGGEWAALLFIWLVGIPFFVFVPKFLIKIDPLSSVLDAVFGYKEDV